MPARFPVSNVFVFRPGAASGTRADAGVPVYTDFSQLYAEMSAVAAGQQVELLFDMTGAASCDIPAGTYDMTNVRWRGWGGWGPDDRDARAIVHLLSGVTISNLSWLENINLNSNASTNPITISAGRMFFRHCLISVIGGQGPIFQVTGTTSTNLYLERTTFGAGSPILTMASTGTLRLVVRDEGCSIHTDPVAGTVGTVEVQYNPASAVSLGTLNFTGYSGTVALVSVTGAQSEVQTVYVAQDNGSDDNSGLSILAPVATLTQAVSVATALTPTSSNRVAIRVLDSRIYNENVVLPSYVSLYAPDATVNNGANVSSLGAESVFHVHKLTGSTTGIAVNSADRVWIRADHIQMSGVGAAIAVNVAATVDIDVGEIEMTSTGSALSNVNGAVNIRAQRLVLGGGIGLALGVAGSLNASVGSITGTGTGLNVGNTLTMNATVNTLNVTTAYNTSTNGTLNLVVHSLTGAASGSGTANVLTPGYTVANSANWAGADPETYADALDRLAAAYTALHGAVP